MKFLKSIINNDIPRQGWVISDGRRGMENQALALAEHCAYIAPLEITALQLNKKNWFYSSPTWLQIYLKQSLNAYNLPSTVPDWVIGCGRSAIAPLIQLKRHFGSAIFTLYVQRPYVNPSLFDLVIAPHHDNISGNNVLTMIGAPNNITPQNLAQAKHEFKDAVNALPFPRACLLIGGHSKHHRLDKAHHLAHMGIAKLLLEKQYSLFISTTRRTPAWAVKTYQDLAQQTSKIWLHTHEHMPNPYKTFLACSNMILVSEDSTNMLTEACTTGIPVFRLPMAGGHKKFTRLYQQLQQRCQVRVFDKPDATMYTPLTETAQIAKKIWDHYRIYKTRSTV